MTLHKGTSYVASTGDTAPAVVDAEEVKGRTLLVAHRIDVGTVVEVELLVPASNSGTSHGPRQIEGAVEGATSAVLLVESPRGRTVRIPWHAIATIRDTPPTQHPATA